MENPRNEHNQSVSKVRNGRLNVNIQNLKNLLVGHNLLENCDISIITTLNLSKCELQNVPLELKDLPLKELNLSHNHLNEIPTCLYVGLENLVSLNLSHNALPKFEMEPRCCVTLQTLNISNNLLKNVPQWILNLRPRNLQEFIYDFNKVSYLRCIFNKTLYFPVRKMSMKNCFLRQADFNFLKNCRNLEELDLSNTNSTVIMNMFKNIDELFVRPTWRNISILKLNNLGISLFPEGLTWQETLNELYLCNNDFMWLPKDGMEFFVNLEILDLSHNSLYNLPDKLTWLIHLRILKLNHNKLEILPDFSSMTSLETLDLYCNELCSFECNMQNTNLKHIDLEYNFFNTEECQLLNYKDMRDEFRHLLKEDRQNNSKADYLLNSDESSKTSDRSSIEELECDAASQTSENWDEEIELHKKEVDISPSDDEWIGFEQIVKEKKKPMVAPSYSSFYNEDVIFCDAD